MLTILTENGTMSGGNDLPTLVRWGNPSGLRAARQPGPGQSVAELGHDDHPDGVEVRQHQMRVRAHAVSRAGRDLPLAAPLMTMRSEPVR
jgi:hypothetical protein